MIKPLILSLLFFCFNSFGSINGPQLPPQSGNSGKFLSTNGSNLSWASGGGGGTPGGSSTQIQFNNSGAFGGAAGLTWDSTNLSLGINESSSSSVPTVNITSGSSTAVPFVITATTNLVMDFFSGNTNATEWRMKNTSSNRQWGFAVAGTAFGAGVPSGSFAFVDNNATIPFLITPSDNTQIGGHLLFSGTAPTLSGCGTGATVTGNDSAGRITIGTTPSASCVVTFHTAFTTNGPSCFANDEVTVVALQTSASTSALTINGVTVASDTVNYHCVGF